MDATVFISDCWAGFLEKKLPLFGEMSAERHTEFNVVECFDLKYVCELILFHAGGGAG